MPTKCLSKCSLFVALALALFLSRDLSAAASGWSSGGRTGGRMGGSTRPFGSYRSPSPPRASSYKRETSTKRECHESLTRDHNKDKKEPVGRCYDNLSSYRTILLCGIVIVACVLLYLYYDPYEAHVLMVQVGLPGTAKSLQRDLNWIARNTNTDDETGFHQVLLDTATVLLNHQNHWISGFSYVDKKSNIGESEKSFKQLCFEERKKVDVESLVNVNGVREERISRHRANSLEKNFIVVTVLVAARGGHELPPIKTAMDLKKAVQTLSSISLNQAMAVEVLWTPQNENDAMSEDEYLEDYYRLRPI